MGIDGRPSYLNDAIHKQFIEYLEMGVTISDAARALGLNVWNYYQWRTAGHNIKQEIERLLAEGASENDPRILELGQKPFYKFYLDSTRANGHAMISAVAAFKSGMVGGQSKTYRTDTTTKTKLKRQVTEFVNEKTGRVNKRVIEMVEYPETTTLRSEITNDEAPDWRAGESFLARRNPAEWGQQKSTADKFHDLVVEMIRNDEISYPELEREAGPQIAAEMWQDAGRPVPMQREREPMLITREAKTDDRS